MGRQLGFWEIEEHYARLSASGDPLETLSRTVDFEPFRYRLEKALKRSDGRQGGRPPYDPVLMFNTNAHKSEPMSPASPTDGVNAVWVIDEFVPCFAA